MTLPTRPIARQPEGTPAGGQFATTTKSEAAGVTLGPADLSPAQIEDAVEVLKQRRDESWPAAAARHDEEEGAWAASNAAVAARELFPHADTIEYRVDKDGRLTDLDVVANHQLVGEVWQDGSGKMVGREWLYSRVGTQLDGRDLDDMKTQGAKVQDDAYTGGAGAKVLRIDLDEAILKAHSRLDGAESVGAVRADTAAQALEGRRKKAWDDAQEQHRHDETAWTASQTADSTREVFPDADEIEYTVDGAGQANNVAIRSNGQVVGLLALDKEGFFINQGKAGQLSGSVFIQLERTSLDEMERQGATVTDDPSVDDGAGKLVRFRFDDAIMKAAERAARG